MKDCVEFLQWCLPLMRMRWAGFRKVHHQVCKRINKRLVELGLVGFDAYQEYLTERPEEWLCLQRLCRVTISRFYRDRAVFNALRWEILPQLAQQARTGSGRVRCWCCGCASGEEVFTLKIVWEDVAERQHSAIPLEIVATDIDSKLLDRGSEGLYPDSSLRELPRVWLPDCFDVQSGGWRIRDRLRQGVEWVCQDLLQEVPTGTFDLILCRYLVFTYFEQSLQVEILKSWQGKLRAGGVLVMGQIEVPPPGDFRLERCFPQLPIYRRLEGS